MDLQRRAYTASARRCPGRTPNRAVRIKAMPSRRGAVLFRRTWVTARTGSHLAPYWITTVAEARKAVQEQSAGSGHIKIWVRTATASTEADAGALWRSHDEAHKNSFASRRTCSRSRSEGCGKRGIDAFAHGVRDRDIDEEFLSMLKTRSGLRLVPTFPIAA